MRTAFRVVEPVSKKYLEQGFGSENTQETGNTTSKQEETTQKLSENYPKSPRNTQETPKKSPRNIEEEILEEIRLSSQISRKELAIRLNRTEDSIRHYLRKLTSKGLIKHEGPTKGGKWVILEK